MKTRRFKLSSVVDYAIGIAANNEEGVMLFSTPEHIRMELPERVRLRFQDIASIDNAIKNMKDLKGMMLAEGVPHKKYSTGNRQRLGNDGFVVALNITGESYNIKEETEALSRIIGKENAEAFMNMIINKGKNNKTNQQEPEKAQA